MGRAKQWYKTNPGYREIGTWGWDDNRLWAKIQKTDNVNDCWTWTGSQHPAGALLGAWRHGVQQMTQARRLVWMSVNNQDVQPYRVTMTCQNQQCCNPNHFELKKNNRPESQ